jgi:hypothetical protein
MVWCSVKAQGQLYLLPYFTSRPIIQPGDRSRGTNLDERSAITGNTEGVSEQDADRRISALKREEVAGGWRRLHNEELHNLYTSPNIY